MRADGPDYVRQMLSAPLGRINCSRILRHALSPNHARSLIGTIVTLSSNISDQAWLIGPVIEKLKIHFIHRDLSRSFMVWPPVPILKVSCPPIISRYKLASPRGYGTFHWFQLIIFSYSVSKTVAGKLKLFYSTVPKILRRLCWV